MKKFYIFDLDGTLCDSMRIWRMETENCDFFDREQTAAAYDRMRKHYERDIELKSGVTEYLKKARAAGVKMCIASATRRDVSEPLLQKTGLLDFMEFYVDCFEVGRFKEHPAVYIEAARRMGACIEDCAVFEDAEYCAKTARRAGFYTVGVRDEAADEEGNTRACCDFFIEDWNTAELISDCSLTKHL